TPGSTTKGRPPRSLQRDEEDDEGKDKKGQALLHNYLIGVDPDERIINEVNAEIETLEDEVHDRVEANEHVEGARGEWIRDSLAMAMWVDYNA
ncbi:hypothetical protein Dimus_037089, partial [Dionaea muscipula]